MYIDDYAFQKELLVHKVYSSWQFITFTRKNMDVVKYCFMMIKNIIEKMTMETNQWEQDLFSDFIQDVSVKGKEGKRITVTTDNQPVYEVNVVEQNVDAWFLCDKLIRDFYQYCMNSLDSISQIANAGLLANNGKKVDTVDFQKMVSIFTKQKYKTAFPKTSTWFEKVNDSIEFKYIEAINNRTKHTADIANKLSMGIFGSDNKTEIGAFYRKGEQHNKKELTDQLQKTIDFLNQTWENFLTVFCDEILLDRYVDNRRHEIGGVYQQKMKDEPKQDLSYAFIPVEGDFASMPNEVYILLAYDKEGIAAHVCPFKNILVRKGEHDILGRYTADDTVGDDCLLGYRKYVKDENTEGLICIFYEKQDDIKFYHKNPFFDITTVSDDDTFLYRSALPF